MYILGLSSDYHDASAALLKDGVVIAAADEERFSRTKHDSGFPQRAIEFCLAQGGITAADLDAVVFYEQTLLKLERVLETFLVSPQAETRLPALIDSWVGGRKFDLVQRLVELGAAPERVHAVTHHASHAAVAFYCSPFSRAAVVVLDGAGEYETMTQWVGDGTTLSQIHSQSLPHSLGLFYSAFTAFLGFEVNEGEYKVMGMAGFGQPVFADSIRALIRLEDGGGFAIAQDCFRFLDPGDVPFTAEMERRFGSPRPPDAPFDPADPTCRCYADLAASLQLVTEEVILHVVAGAVARTGLTDVCIAGGVGLNSLANARVRRELGVRLYVPPAAGDSGAAVGAALLHHHRQPGVQRCPPLLNPYLGGAESEDAIQASFHRFRPHNVTSFASSEALVEPVAALLAAGKVVGWSQGRFEWGPRALGNRSILADPRRAEMQYTVNTKIKYREPFRPFAPAVLAEHAATYFELPDDIGPSSPEMFMLAVARVRPDMAGRIQAVTHVDGTARVQVVSRQSNPLFYALIERFYQLTGVPVLLNTSFNLRGEAMAANTYDALDTYTWSDMDAVAIGRHLLRKEPV